VGISVNAILVRSVSIGVSCDKGASLYYSIQIRSYNSGPVKGVWVRNCRLAVCAVSMDMIVKERGVHWRLCRRKMEAKVRVENAPRKYAGKLRRESGGVPSTGQVACV